MIWIFSSDSFSIAGGRLVRESQPLFVIPATFERRNISEGALIGSELIGLSVSTARVCIYMPLPILSCLLLLSISEELAAIGCFYIIIFDGKMVLQSK